MGIRSDRDRGFQQQPTSEPSSEYINSDSNTVNVKHFDKRSQRNRVGNFFVRQLRLLFTEQLHYDNPRGTVPIHSKLSRTWDDQPDNNTKGHNYKKRHRYNKYIYPVIATVLSVNSLPLQAENVGGVSATANPIANSSGSVTNQAIQVLQGPYITNTYGNGVQCQGSTLNITPYIQFADSRKDPWVDFYNEPQYDMTDFTGRTTQQTITVKNYPWESWYDTRTKADGTRWFPDGEDMEITVDVNGPDGRPDNPGNVLWNKPVRTDMSANQSFNAGLSATLSIPLNKKLQQQCHEAAQAQNDLQAQVIANKRLDFEIARLKNCGELKKAGIMFHPKSPYFAVCADVVVTTPGGQLQPHSHNIPSPKWIDPSSSSSTSDNQSQVVPSSSDKDLSSLPLEKDGKQNPLVSFFQNLLPSSKEVSQPSESSPLEALQIGHLP